MSNYLTHIPIELYREVLLQLPPDALYNQCQTEKYTNMLCVDEKFMRQYIMANFSPIYYRMSEWSEHELALHGFYSWSTLLKFAANEYSRFRITYLIPNSGQYDEETDRIPEIGISEFDTLGDLFLKFETIVKAHNLNIAGVSIESTSKNGELYVSTYKFDGVLSVEKMGGRFSGRSKDVIHFDDKNVLLKDIRPHSFPIFRFVDSVYFYLSK